MDITHYINFYHYPEYFYATHNIKTSLGALHYPVLIVTSQTNNNFIEFVYKIKVTQYYSPNEKQVKGGKYLIKRISDGL
jgi:hypothetical protein